MTVSTTTAAVVADWLGISSRRVKDLRAEGVLPGDAGEKYDLKACVTAYCAHMRPTKGRSAAGGSAAAETFDEARIRLLNEQADGQAMKNAQTRGELVSRAEVNREIALDYRGVRDGMLSLPLELAPQLFHCKTLPELQAKLDDAVRERLEYLARTDFTSKEEAAHDR